MSPDLTGCCWREAKGAGIELVGGGGGGGEEEVGVRWRRAEAGVGCGVGGCAYGSIPGRKAVPQPLFDPVTGRTSFCCFGSESATDSKHTTPSVWKHHQQQTRSTPASR